MKIENQTSSVLKKQNFAKTANLSFEDFLRGTKKITGDDFFRQHLNSWMPSYLSFKARNVNAAKPLSLLEEPATNSISLNETIHAAIKILTTPCLNNTQALDTQSYKIPLEKNAPTPNIKTLNHYVENPQELPMVDAEPEHTTLPPLLNKFLSKTPTHQSYQVFVNKQDAEVAINTSFLSKEDTQALQALIKKTLILKGYTLKHLIINGVLQ